ncbi:hypothetical protein MKX03_002192 [Papaver bracteatum]|nr:hypothetical protein MKX03_002192 [Papaver bracteatum]
MEVEGLVLMQLCIVVWNLSNSGHTNIKKTSNLIELYILSYFLMLIGAYRRQVELLLHPSPTVLIHSLRTVGNIVTGDDRQTQVLRGYIKPLCDLLICRDARIVTVCLEGLENILKVGEAEKTIGNTDGVNLHAHMIDEAEGL